MKSKLKNILSEINWEGKSVELGKVYSNPYANAFKPQENSVNEMQVVNKKTGKDITRYVLDLLSGKIDKKKFEKLTGLKKESVNEADDHEVGMGLSALKESVRSAKIIYDEIKKRDIQELEGWVQHKLTLASDYLNTVAQYMEDLDEYDDKDKE
jgi:light-regulated signal transduction histidine kinase (bacteriophytochrome)